MSQELLFKTDLLTNHLLLTLNYRRSVIPVLIVNMN